MAPQAHLPPSEGEAASVTSPGRAESTASVSLRLTPDQNEEKGQGIGLTNDQQADLLSIGAWTSGDHAVGPYGRNIEGRQLLHISSLSAAAHS